MPGHVATRKTDSRDGWLILLARILFALSVLLLLTSLISTVILANRGEPYSLSGSAFDIGVVLANGLVGLLIISRHLRHAVGWLLLILGLNYALGGLQTAVDVIDSSSWSSSFGLLADFLVWVSLWSWLPLATIPTMFLPLFFPDGWLLSKRWRFVPIVLTIGLLAGIVSWAVHPGPFDANVPPNPFQLSCGEALADLLWQYVTIPLFWVGFLGAYGSIVLRYRRSGRVERTQMKWVLYLLILTASVTVAVQVMGLVMPDLGEELAALNVSNAVIWLLSIVLPIVIGIAILRYRLFDIDIIIRRTLVYSLVTVMLGAVYFGSVVLLQRLFSAAASEQSPAAIVLSTLLIAALFGRVRGRAQEFVDRRFYRAKYDAAQTLARFAETARDEVELEALTAELAKVIEETIQPEAVTIWLKEVV